LGQEAEKVGQHLASFLNDEGGIAEFVDDSGVVQGYRAVVFPELVEFRQHLVEILFGADGYLSFHVMQRTTLIQRESIPD
jgi:hypothetical protein